MLISLFQANFTFFSGPTPTPIRTDELSSAPFRGGVSWQKRKADGCFHILCVCVCVPPNEAHWSGPVSVHEDAEWQRSSTEQEGANGKAQIEHLLLLYTAVPILMCFSTYINHRRLIF